MPENQPITPQDISWAPLITKANANSHPETVEATGQPWQALLDASSDGIWGIDLEGRCTFVNRAAVRMLGYQASELIGRNMHGIVHHHHPDGSPYPAQDCSVYGVLQHGFAFSNEVEPVIRKDGSRFWAEMSAEPILLHGEVTGAVVTFRDMTKSLMAEQALRRSEKLAAVGQLSSSIAHEINNPLEAVLNLVYLVRSSPTLEEARTYAALAEVEVVRVADITMQTLRFHRQQSSAAPVDLQDTIASILRLYSARFPARRIKVNQRMKASQEPYLLESDIRQVINNLIRNSYDAMQQGGVLHIRLHPADCLRTGTPGIRMTIADTGTGFLPAMRGHLFEPFHTTKEVTGTGLGLWITKGIVDKHEGRIYMRSREGEGTVFTIWLPIHTTALISADMAEPVH